MRIEEHFSNADFRNKVVSQKDIIYWWRKLPRGNINYMHFWDGFNFPDKNINKFKKTYKNEKLLREEQNVLKVLEKINPKSPYYIITGVNNETLIHELHHAMFYLDKKYRNAITKIVNKYNTKEIENKLRIKMGYPLDTMVDEVAAYLIDGGRDLVKECGIDVNKYKNIMLPLLQLYTKNIVKLANIKIIDHK
jgi:hypothetical protein